MSNNIDFTSAIKEGLRLGQERLKTKDRINEILAIFANELQTIISEENGKKIVVQKKHIIIHKKLSRLAVLASVGLEDPPIEEEFDAICFFDEATINTPFVVFRYEIDPVKGFPCRIQYDSSSLSCKDEAALLETIKEAVKYKGLAINEKVRELVSNSNKKEKQ